MLILSSTVGSPTVTGWNRRSSAASFSMCFRYSSSVVAPTVCSSPRASIGFSIFQESIPPSPRPQAFAAAGDTDPRLAEGVRVVLRAPREHLDDAADLVVAADYRIE